MKKLWLLALLGVTPAHANLITNGGFETGDLTGWNSNWGVYGYAGSEFDPNPYGGGNYFASTGCLANYPSPCYVSQSVATPPGTEYLLTFDFNPGSYAAPDQGDTKVYFGSTLVADLLGGDLGWTAYSFDVMTTSDSPVLEFIGYQTPDQNGLDNVALDQTPLPASWLLLGSVLAAFGFIRRSAQACAGGAVRPASFPGRSASAP